MSHVVTTTTTTTTSSSGGGVVNLGYGRSVSGLLKIAQVVTLLIAYLCVSLSRTWTDYSALRYFEVVTLWFLIAFSIFFLLHILRLTSKIPCINWTLTEFLHYVIGTILIFIAAIVVAIKAHGVSALIAGSVFAFIATALLGYNVWTSYRVTCGSQPTGAAV
ncbi:CKLF-like MARVEL transmembrane domain-containing protein 7 [Engraulis encrasicolus]|uniref:CKLF-like MARVEL transmembrane domain-containing protein 7 n=1 Tax=Engraulis encrasicolus TaxID=184585 RepID=UPI002FD31771